MPFDWQPLLQQCDIVIHLAGIAHRFASDDLYDQVNHRATAALAAAAFRCGTRHLVFVSSIAAQWRGLRDQPRGTRRVIDGAAAHCRNDALTGRITSIEPRAFRGHDTGDHALAVHRERQTLH
jgi:hypothetical protein